jgi:predicted dehydrogenase
MVTKVGTIGFSEGNGHPFSFSAIVNGYDDAAFEQAGWPVIHDYLREQPKDRFGFDNIRITHAWSPDLNQTTRLCRACRIDQPLQRIEDMVSEVDAVLIARDDWETHAELVRPFLAEGKYVFVDKPLTLDEHELAEFIPHLCSGQLMSTSGMRFASELDTLRQGGLDREIGRLKLIQGTVVNGLEKYGIHLIEAVAQLGNGLDRPVSVTRVSAAHESYLIRYENDVLFTLNCLGNCEPTFHLSFFGAKGHRHFDLHNNFTAFRRTLAAFFLMVRGERNPINPTETTAILRLIMRARDLEPDQIAAINLGVPTSGSNKKSGNCEEGGNEMRPHFQVTDSMAKNSVLGD